MTSKDIRKGRQVLWKDSGGNVCFGTVVRVFMKKQFVHVAYQDDYHGHGVQSVCRADFADLIEILPSVGGKRLAELYETVKAIP